MGDRGSVGRGSLIHLIVAAPGHWEKDGHWLSVRGHPSGRSSEGMGSNESPRTPSPPLLNKATPDEAQSAVNKHHFARSFDSIPPAAPPPDAPRCPGVEDRKSATDAHNTEDDCP